MDDKVKYRKDGSRFNIEQLRYKGKFIRQRVNLTLPDRLVLESNGYTAEESELACKALNIEIEQRIRSGESEEKILSSLREIV